MKKNRVIAVIDLKAFYSFVECVDRGLDPFNTPLVVADKERGKNTIVLSVTPYLKSRGVPSRLRINDLPKGYDYIYAVPRMARYVEMSSKVMSIILDFISEEDLHVYSIDEAFLDLTSYITYYKKTPRELVKYIIDTIKEKTGLFATAGIGDNFFLAKVALDIYAKKSKDGIAIIHQDEIKEKIWPITPLNKVWGIGQRLEARLNALNIFTMKDLALSNIDFIKDKFGVIGEQLVMHANGIDDADMHEEYVPVSRSLTIGQVLMKDYSKEEAKLIILEMSDDISRKLRSEGLTTEVVSLYIGYSKEGGFARQLDLSFPTTSSKEIYEALMEIYEKHMDKKKKVRRISICLGKLKLDQHYDQLSLFKDPDEKIKDKGLDTAIDSIKSIFGDNAVLRCSSLLSYSTIKERHSQIGGHRR